MKLQKRLLALFLILAMWLSLTGCGNDTAPDTGAVSTTSAVTTTSTTVADSDNGGDITTTGATTTAPTKATDTVITLSKPVTTTTTATNRPTTTTQPTTAATVSSADKQTVDAAFQLGVGAKMENVTLTGVVTDSQGYDGGYGNATFDLQVQGTSGAKTIYCYRVKPADPNRTDVAVGDVLRLDGTIQHYTGTIEFYPATYTHLGGGTTATPTTRPTGGGAAIDENGIYDSKEDVALYIHTYGKLPKNYFPKSEFNKKDKYQCCGGDRFYNKEGRLPNGETYYECDIDTYGITSRGAKRLVWTKSGIVYYTGDHYETFTQLYGER